MGKRRGNCTLGGHVLREQEKQRAMEEELREMKAEFYAMKAAQTKSVCPEGYAEGSYEVLCRLAADGPAFQSRIDEQRREIIKQQERIDEQRREAIKQQERIDEQRREAVKQQERIDEQRRETVKQQDRIDEQRREAIKRQERIDEQRREAVKQQECMASVEALVVAYAAGSSLNRDIGLAAKFKRCQAAATIGSLVAGVEKLMHYIGSDTDKCHIPLMTVVGSSGQGKTEALLWFRDDKNVHHQIMDAVNKHLPVGSKPVKVVTTAMATFNQSSTYNVTLEGDKVHFALTHRLTADWLGKRFDSELILRIGALEATELIRHMRTVVARGAAVEPSQVVVVILVDEIMKLARGAHTPGDRMSMLLDDLCALQQAQLEIGHAAFVVCSCLQVSSLFATVTSAMKRPLHNIPLLPCSDDDTAAFVNKCFAAAKAVHPSISNDLRRRLEWRAAACAGHYRSLEELWTRFVGTLSCEGDSEPSPGDVGCALEIVAWNHVHYRNRKAGMTDTGLAELQALSLFRVGCGHTIWDLVSGNLAGVLYAKVNVAANEVWPCVQPRSIQRGRPDKGDVPFVKEIFTLLPSALSGVLAEPGTLVKSCEFAFPALEAIMATILWHYEAPTTTSAAPRRPPTVADVFPGALVTPWVSGEVVVYNPECYLFCSMRNKAIDDCARLEDVRKYLKDAACTPVTGGTVWMAPLENYPAIEGMHTLMGIWDGVHVRAVPVFFQMKMGKVATPAVVAKWIRDAHTHAQHVLGAKEEGYYVVLYSAVTVEVVGDSVPQGTIVLSGDTLLHLLRPFGFTPILDWLTAKG